MIHFDISIVETRYLLLVGQPAQALQEDHGALLHAIEGIQLFERRAANRVVVISTNFDIFSAGRHQNCCKKKNNVLAATNQSLCDFWNLTF